jgi:hypothetical protein
MTQWLLIRRLRGPAFLLLVGIMAMLHEWTEFGFTRSWPLFLILAGVLALAERAALAQATLDNYDPITGQPLGPTGVPYAAPQASSATGIVPATPPSGTDVDRGGF